MRSSTTSYDGEDSAAEMLFVARCIRQRNVGVSVWRGVMYHSDEAVFRTCCLIFASDGRLYSFVRMPYVFDAF